MKNLWTWILLLILILILLGVYICQTPPVHNHFVSSGNINFQGSAPGSYGIDEHGGHFSVPDDCFFQDTDIEIHHDFFLPVSCDRLIDASTITTGAINFNSSLGSVGSTRLGFHFFAGGIKDQNAITSLHLNLQNINNQQKDDVTITDDANFYEFDGTQGICFSHLTLTMNVNTSILPLGTPLHLVVEMMDHDKYHNHTTAYPDCFGQQEFSPGNENDLSDGQKKVVNPEQLEMMHLHNALGGPPTCNPLPLNTSLAYYQCLEESKCHIMDHIMIIELPPVCLSPNSPQDANQDDEI